MRSVIDFYRRRPLVLAVAVVLGVAVAILTATIGDSDGVVLPIVFVALAGIALGAAIGAAQRRQRR